MKVDYCISQLINYALEKGLIEPCDKMWAVNRLLEILKKDGYEEPEDTGRKEELEDILSGILDYAAENGIIEENDTTRRDLFDTAVMGCLTPRPSEVIKKFRDLYALSPEKATDFYYDFSCSTDYIRRYRIKKDIKWVTATEYGDLDITVNLSKPEKDPKAIAAAKLVKQTGYPKCMLCPQNEGYAGRLNHPARQNHRIIPIKIDGKDWGFQYSPYVYYNEHCIVFNFDHTPMVIDRSAFTKLFDFVRMFPHYFVGSNADLPIVGGSILTHEHFQGGHYTFAMAKAEIEKYYKIKGFEDLEIGRVKWPMSVLRLRGESAERITDLADKILTAWRAYTDEECFIYAETDGEKHNTITPIARKNGDKYELDLVLRNNITTEEHPLGVYHPHADKHNIKKENIGLIEVMGLAVLPSRLKNEMALLEKAILENKDFKNDEVLSKHYDWFCAFKNNYTFTAENTAGILKAEIGKTFRGVLEDAGVYKRDEKGFAGFDRFVNSLD